MKKIIIFCVVTCLHSNIFSMLLKYGRTTPKNNFVRIKTGNNRTQFNFPYILQQLKAQEQSAAVQEQIKLIELLMAKQKESIDENIATHWKIEDRDFSQGNMHKE